MTEPVLIIQNDAKEGAGQLATLIAERGLEQETVLGYDTDYGRLSADDYSALVVLGGAQSAYETDEYPYLCREIGLCQDFMKAGKPIAAFCVVRPRHDRSGRGRSAHASPSEDAARLSLPR